MSSSPPKTLEAEVPADATLEVTSAPWSVLFVDNRRVGFTPATVPVPPGTHQLRVEREGYITVERSLTIQADHAARWSPTLQAKPK